MALSFFIFTLGLVLECFSTLQQLINLDKVATIVMKWPANWQELIWRSVQEVSP